MISYLDNKGVNTFYIVYSPLYCTLFLTKILSNHWEGRFIFVSRNYRLEVLTSIYASSDGLHAVPLKKESNWLLDYDSNESGRHSMPSHNVLLLS